MELNMPKISEADLVKLFQTYIDEAETQLESDNFLPGLDVTEPAAVDLLNDILTYLSAADLIEPTALHAVKSNLRSAT
jgi:hypothetical protein